MANSRFNPPPKLKVFHKDIAPIGFYFDIFATELFHTPILPLPMRIDKLSNGEPTLFIKLDMKKLESISEKFNLCLNLYNFYLMGIRNFVHYARAKIKEITLRPLDGRKVEEWWETSKSLSTITPDLIETFTFINLNFIETFALIKERNLLPTQEDYTKALLTYCDKIVNFLREKIDANTFTLSTDNEVSTEKLYIEKKKKFYPLIIKIPVYNEMTQRSYQMEFVPYLIYDDLLDVFFFNANLLRKGEKKTINLKVYEDTQIINTRSATLNVKAQQNNLDLNDLNIEKVLNRN
jgi:hypothetical protein